MGELGTRDTGGMSVYVSAFSKELGKRGHRVDIYTRHSETAPGQIVALHGNVRLIHLRPEDDQTNGHVPKSELYPHLAGYFKALGGFMSAEGTDYDLVHSNYWLSGVLGGWMQDQWGMPHVMTYHTLGAVKDDARDGEKEPEIRLSTEKRLAGLCDRILAPTQQEKENLVQYCDVPPGKIGLVPCGVNRSQFHPMDRPSARKRLGFDMGEKILLFVGRLDPMKGLDRLVAAVACLRDRRDFRLVIAGGDGREAQATQRLRELARKLNTDDCVDLIGRIGQEDLLYYYNAADAVVLPSYYESFGLVALEALACGTPVVATRVGAMAQILRDGETGFLVSEGSPCAIAESIEAVFSEPSLWSAHMIRDSVSEYDWSNVVSELIKEYALVT